MPHQPVLKLCATCDQVSLVRSTSRRVRCRAPVPWRGGEPCESRRVTVLSLAEFNALRAQEKAVWQARVEEHDDRILQLELTVAALQAVVRPSPPG